MFRHNDCDCCTHVPIERSVRLDIASALEAMLVSSTREQSYDLFEDADYKIYLPREEN